MPPDARNDAIEWMCARCCTVGHLRRDAIGHVGCGPCADGVTSTLILLATIDELAQ